MATLITYNPMNTTQVPRADSALLAPDVETAIPKSLAKFQRVRYKWSDRYAQYDT